MSKITLLKNAVFSGRKLTTMQGAYEFGTTKLPTRIGEIERSYGVLLDRKQVVSNGIRFYEYQLDKKKHKEQIKNYRKSLNN